MMTEQNMQNDIMNSPLNPEDELKEKRRQNAAKARAAAAAKRAERAEREVVQEARAETPRRTDRIPLGTPQRKLALQGRPGYVQRFFNDKDDRIQRAMAAGYEPVKDTSGANDRRAVGGQVNGAPMQAVAMEIPEEWYKEDQARKQALIDQKEAQIKRASLNPVENQYFPAGGIKIEKG